MATVQVLDSKRNPKTRQTNTKRRWCPSGDGLTLVMVNMVTASASADPWVDDLALHPKTPVPSARACASGDVATIKRVFQMLPLTAS